MPTNNELLHAIMKEMYAPHAGTDPAAAAVAIGIWEKMAGKFAPLIGPGSISLLFSRSVESNRAAFSWLPPVPDRALAGALAALELSFEDRQASEVIAAMHAMLNTFIGLLATLIGARLTFQFLRSAFPGDDTQQNTQENPE